MWHRLQLPTFATSQLAFQPETPKALGIPETRDTIVSAELPAFASKRGDPWSKKHGLSIDIVAKNASFLTVSGRPT